MLRGGGFQKKEGYLPLHKLYIYSTLSTHIKGWEKSLKYNKSKTSYNIPY